MAFTKTRLMWLVAVLLPVTALVVAWLWPTTPPQIITFPDGVQYRFVGATWGTKHSQPGILAHVVDRLPKKWADYARKKLNPRFSLVPPWRTSAPDLVIWLQVLGTNQPPRTNMTNFGFMAVLADQRGISSGRGTSGLTYLSSAMSELQFELVPRRSRILEFDVVELPWPLPADTNFAHLTRIRFRNPAYGSFPKWEPETLPDVKSNGELRVSLKSFVVSSNEVLAMKEWISSFSVSFESPRGTNESWEVESSELDDAIGNRMAEHYPGLYSDARVRGHVDASGTSSDDTYHSYGALWPGESAWRLKLGFKRTFGVPASDLVTFSNFSVFPSSLTNYDTGTPIIILNYNMRGPHYYGGAPAMRWIYLNAPKLPTDSAADIVAATTDTGMPVPLSPTLGYAWLARICLAM